MKKIIPFILVVYGFNAAAQSTVPETAKSVSISEASRQQNAGGTMINGKPYAQYKAEQDALKLKQQQPVQRVSHPQEVSITPANMPSKQQVAPVNTLKGNETTEPAPLIDTKVVAEKPVTAEAVQHVRPSMDDATPNAAITTSPEKKATGPEKPAYVAPKVNAPVVQAKEQQAEVTPAQPAGLKLEKGPVSVDKPAEQKTTSPSSTDGQANVEKTKTN